MVYLGGGPYQAEPCPVCGGVMWNGRCENPDCRHHWYPLDSEDAGNDVEEKKCSLHFFPHSI